MSERDRYAAIDAFLLDVKRGYVVSLCPVYVPPPLLLSFNVSMLSCYCVRLCFSPFCLLLCLRKYRGMVNPSLSVTKKAAELHRSVVSHTGRIGVDGLLKKVRAVGKLLAQASPFELIIDNVTRRILYIIREQYECAIRDFNNPNLCFTPELSPMLAPGEGPSGVAALDLGGASGPDRQTSNASFAESFSENAPLERTMSIVNPPLHGMMEPAATDYDFVNPTNRSQELLWSKGEWKKNVLDHINDYIDEFDNIVPLICGQAQDHLHDNELILTIGSSYTVETFLKHAAKKRKTLQVFVAECSPTCLGHDFAAKLAEAGIKTTVITDSMIFAVMTRVTKVLIGAHAVLADGGIVARAGTHLLALAAQAHRIPVVVLTGLNKLSPVFPVNPKSFSEMASPEQLISLHEVRQSNAKAQSIQPASEDDESDIRWLQVYNPMYDYVPPELIHTFITNSQFGSHNPSYTYRLLVEFYNPEDHDL
eukprot:NODE_1202_length_1646_cov_34.623043_g1067_i0.p1 GENE.NODE_1202_length_1646_cov_34.623043_g1067_i0~~NODE_1202_length_1646_cov_34.623043_g1067_i0.p1  ORF type:complete len:479 (-),score=53.06 NODE_1202_length_1646_cov_34.623043_g1067_i0:81-1517(-)